MYVSFEWKPHRCNKVLYKIHLSVNSVVRRGRPVLGLRDVSVSDLLSGPSVVCNVSIKQFQGFIIKYIVEDKYHK